MNPMHSISGPTDRVFGLDVLRSTAVLMVLVAHSKYLLRPVLPSTAYLSIFGFLGVELFFVLSGFLIGGILLRTFPDAPTSGTVVHFWIRRWFRTLPNYYLFLAVNLVIAIALGRNVADVLAYGLFLQNAASAIPPFFNESWSLAVEEWFYLLFPILLLVGTRLGLELRVACAAAMLLLFAFSTGARVAAVASGNPLWDSDLRKVVIFRFDALMFGVLGGWTKFYFGAAWDRLRRPGVALGTVLVCAVVVAYYGTNRDESILARTWLFPATSVAFLLLLPAFDSWRVAFGRLATWTRRISLWSYSLYLAQVPVAMVLRGIFGDPSRMGIALILGVTIGYFVLSIGVSALAYRFFEKPAMNLRDRFRDASRSALGQPRGAAPSTETPSAAVDALR